MGTIGQEDGEPPVVATSSGAVRGVWDGSAAVFRGIPYAEAPSGPLLFARPVSREPWDGVFDASGFGPTPLRGDTGVTIIPEVSVPGEDTLSVNVWTPTLDREAGLPVVVWIHGGGFISGSPASPWYDGRAFARDGVVLVTISYRLGFIGFGWVEDGVQNRGVLDWICALEWVQEHIRAFGGDPGRVTIAGQSAGGGAVLTLLGVPKAAGLFRGAYALSAAIADPSVEEARRRSRALARLAGVQSDAAGLSSLSEARIIELQRSVTRPAPSHLLHDLHELLRDGLMIGPVADGEIVPGDALTAVSRGSSSHAPLVLGTAAGELVSMFGAAGPAGAVEHLPRRALLRALGVTSGAATEWLSTLIAKGSANTVALLEHYATDAVFRSWIPRVAAARAGTGAGTTWSYSFEWHPDDPPQAGHCIAIPFLFDRLDAPGVAAIAGPEPPQELADAVHGSLVRFAERLDPGWPPDAAGAGPSHLFDLPETESLTAYDSARALLGPFSSLGIPGRVD